MAEDKKNQETEELKDKAPQADTKAAEQEEKAEEKKEKKKKSKKDKREEQIEELGQKLQEMQDKHLRLQAEFDNFRRRTIKEKADLIKSGGESVLVNILPVIDDFERAIDAMKDLDEEDAGKHGTKLIYSKFQDFLKQNNVKEIQAQNEVFDVDLHEAITKIPAPSEDLKGKVVDVVQKGYCLNEKVIRFAKVVIGE
ncbi:MAG TPA: nucleotide exchange factor GrpE [Draconibacterium sp.]|nr:nucleotide exchange factor GrpE [Draconibacterium sp.]